MTLVRGPRTSTEPAVLAELLEPVAGMLAIFWLDQYEATALSTLPVKALALKAGAPDRTV